MLTPYDAYLKQNHDRFIDELLEFLRIPSISALPEHAGDIDRAANWVADRLKAAGLEHVEIMPTSGYPVVYANWLHAPERPTVLIYGHFDVQPADPFDLWDSPPFEPRVEHERIYARGASDDKGNLLSPIIAVEALLQTEQRLPLNVKFLLEGQEEVGSPQLPEFLACNRQKLTCDLAVSADGLQWSPDQPKIELGYRGICGLQIDVQGPASDLHSGLYGGMIHNPIQALSHLLAALHDDAGHIAAPGFYDDVIDLTDTDRQLMAKPPFDAAGICAQLGVDALFGEPEYTPVERLWARPTIEIVGISGGFQGHGAKSIVPSRAQAKLSCRLVANQDPQRIAMLVKRHIYRQRLPGVRVQVTDIEGRALPYLMPHDHPGNLSAAQVLTELYGSAPFFTRCGGSIPACGLFLKTLGVYTVNFSFSYEDENLHAPNEFVRLESLKKGQIGYAMLLRALDRQL